jgi:hypothetical protein
MCVVNEIMLRSMLQGDSFKRQHPVLEMLKASLLEGCGGFGEIHMRSIETF